MPVEEKIVGEALYVATNGNDSWSGKQVSLKGTADVQGANIQYSWDYGDGTPITTGTVTDRYAIESRHTYSGLVGDVFAARLTVENTTTGESSSEAYFVQLRDRTLETEVNVAIDEGLWYIHKNQYRFTTSGVDYGDWRTRSGCYSCQSYWSLYASNLNAFEANGHTETGSDSNPYVETVARGMRHLFTGLTTEGLGLRTYPAPTGTVNPEPRRCSEVTRRRKHQASPIRYRRRAHRLPRAWSSESDRRTPRASR